MTSPTGSLQVITNDKFNKVLPAKCKVQMFDTVEVFKDDFVVVGMKGTEPQLHYNADTVTLGYAWLMIGQAFKQSFSKLPDDMREKILNLLAEGE